MKKLFLTMGIVCAGLALCACYHSSGGNTKPEDKDDPTDVKPVIPFDPPPEDDPIKPGDISVTFDTAEGEFAEGKTSVTLKVGNDGKVTLEQQPYRDGYAFDGWYNGTVKYNPDTVYTATQTFTAKYSYGGDDVVYTALFDENSTVGIQINMSDAEWKKLDADKDAYQKSPIYRYADNVVITIKQADDGVKNYYYEGVGVRMKGNTSRHKFYNGDGFYNAIHMKLSFKETFDDVEDGYKSDELYDWGDDTDGRKFRKDRTLGGMTKIDIKYNSTLDETYIRELYAMRLFRDNGIYAPNITLGSVYALEKDSDLKNLGVYRIHEPIDEQFIARHIETTVGDLYKCTWGNSSCGADLTYDEWLESRVGVNDELKNELYAYEKKTNKKKDKTTGLRDFSSILTFIENINDRDGEIRQYIDEDYFAAFEAVNYILGNPDCIRNHANNYYLYFRKSDGKAIFIPYDYDRCLGNITWNPANGMLDMQPFTRQTTIDEFGRAQRNPLYIRLIDKGAPYDAGSVLMKYRSNLLTVADSDMLKIGLYNALKDKYRAHYGKYTATAIGGKDGNNQGFDDNSANNISVSDYITAKLKVLRDNIDNYKA